MLHFDAEAEIGRAPGLVVADADAEARRRVIVDAAPRLPAIEVEPVAGDGAEVDRADAEEPRGGEGVDHDRVA